MKILHTGDWHVGSYKGPTADGKNLRMEDTCRCIEELVAKAELEEPDVVVIAGDLFKTNAAWETSGMPGTEYVSGNRVYTLFYLPDITSDLLTWK